MQVDDRSDISISVKVRRFTLLLLLAVVGTTGWLYFSAESAAEKQWAPVGAIWLVAVVAWLVWGAYLMFLVCAACARYIPISVKIRRFTLLLLLAVAGTTGWLYFSAETAAERQWAPVGAIWLVAVVAWLVWGAYLMFLVCAAFARYLWSVRNLSKARTDA
ncbi:hypothetical protein SDC9_78348 [bioreactor metagenome]|uniref:Uncharacterized protein n=1 Tax=bioreactor metagenome TaxID=1076179 RepID=A0A644YVB8_9ZZZZ